MNNAKYFQVVGEVGGVSSTSCSAFLSNLEEWDQETGVVYGLNNHPSKALLLPIKGLVNSSTVLKLIDCKLKMFFLSKYI